jgi:two-component system, NarL family, invasion response regulator UvrY
MPSDSTRTFDGSGRPSDGPPAEGVPRPVTVLVVDDQPVFLRVARDLIAATPGFEQVGQASSGGEALELAAAVEPDLVLLDVRMPGMDGIETARRLVASDSPAVVVLISLDELPGLPPLLARKTVTQLSKQHLSARALHAVWAACGP